MIDIKEYNLVFWRKEDGQRFIGRRTCPGQYVLYDIFTKAKLPLGKKALDRLFITDLGNSKRQSRVFKRSA